MQALATIEIRTRHDRIVRNPHLATVTLEARPEQGFFTLSVTGNAVEPDHPRTTAFANYASRYIASMKKAIEGENKPPMFTLTPTSSGQSFSAIIVPGQSAAPVTGEKMTEIFKGAHKHVIDALGDPIIIKDISQSPSQKSRS